MDVGTLGTYYDPRVAGSERWVVRDHGGFLMLIPDEIRKCVAFVQYQDAESGRKKPAGTAFFTSVDLGPVGWGFNGGRVPPRPPRPVRGCGSYMYVIRSVVVHPTAWSRASIQSTASRLRVVP